MKAKTILQRVAQIATVIGVSTVLLAACGTTSSKDAAQSNNNECSRKNSEGICFPDPERTWVHDKFGTYINPQNVFAVRAGMTKDEVRETISYPHFKEGFFGVKEWNYLFKFRTAATGSEFVSCQYKVKFDEENRVQSTHWYEPYCDGYLRPPVVREIAVSTPAKKPVTDTIIIGTDALFAFDRADLRDLRPGGKEKLDNLLLALRNNYTSVEWLFVTGYTDPLGGEAYNQRLSEARANSVRNFLLQNNFPANTIISKGLAAQQLVKTCPTNLSIPDLIDCHQPNRRVTVEVRGYRK